MTKVFLLLLFSVLTIFAQDSVMVKDTTENVQTETVQTPPPKSNEPSRWYYGGTIGLNFWSDYFLLSLEPMVGYNVSPKFSLGGKVNYTYINYEGDLTASNYGASIFGRYRPTPFLYLHTEFAYMNYEIPRIVGSERVWVPFILVGAGFVKPISHTTSVYLEVLFDVLQDDNSPYEEWDPIVHVGVGVGF